MCGLPPFSISGTAMTTVTRVATIVLCLLLIPVTAAVLTAAVKQRFSDGPNRVFSGGTLESGELHGGSEPNWSFVSGIPTIEMQLVTPPRSRRIWTAEYNGRLCLVWLHGHSRRSSLEALAGTG